MSAEDLRRALGRGRLLAIVRGADAARASTVLSVLAEEGVEVAEISLSDPRGVEAIEEATRTLGDSILLGAGTVTSAVQVERAAAAGARFVVTPGLAADVSAACGRLGLTAIPGAFTPTEVAAALRTRPAAVKLFPAGLLGPRYLRDLRGPFSGAPFVPVGGVETAQAGAYLEAGALAVGVGSPLMGDVVEGGSLDGLRSRVRALRRAVAAT